MSGADLPSILVTGCSSGIGYHCAVRLRGEGWRVFATARRDEDISRLRAEGFESLYLDYRDEDSVNRAFSSVMAATGGRLSALFNNGAHAQGGAVEDLPTPALREQFEANFFGWHALTRLAVPVMRRQGSGRIVHCSSVLGVVAAPWRGAYVASKHAVEGLFASLRQELRGSGIHVVMIEPGPIVSRLGMNAIPYLHEYIDIEGSVFADRYRAYLESIASQQVETGLRLGPEAVYRKLRHALTASRPRLHYPVTAPSHAAFLARRLLPARWLDRLLAGD